MFFIKDGPLLSREEKLKNENISNNWLLAPIFTPRLKQNTNLPDPSKTEVTTPAQIMSSKK